MTQRLEGRTALITGASRGIGASIAKAYAKEGAHVILLARTIGGLEEVDDQIKAQGGNATLMPIDLLKLDDLNNLGPTIAEHFGKLDILVGNAGLLGSLGPVAMSDAKLWHKVFNVNVHANYQLIRTLDPLLRGSDAGRAIFVTSSVAQKVVPNWGAYAASKAALEQMVKTYATEVAHSPLKVNIVDPGATRTDMRAEAFPGEDPTSLKGTNDLVEDFIRLAMPDCTSHGETIRAAA